MPRPKKNNPFTSADKVLAMVHAAEVDIPDDKVVEIYSTIKRRWNEVKKDEQFYINFKKLSIETKLSAGRYRPLSDVLFDISEVWHRSDSMERDWISGVMLDVVDNDFYEVMDSAKQSLYQIEIPDSIYQSGETLHKALLSGKETVYNPTISACKKYIKYLHHGIIRATQDKSVTAVLDEIGIDAGFSADYDGKIKALVELYQESDMQTAIQQLFWYGTCWDSLIFANVMHALYYNYYGNPIVTKWTDIRRVDKSLPDNWLYESLSDDGKKLYDKLHRRKKKSAEVAGEMPDSNGNPSANSDISLCQQ